MLSSLGIQVEEGLGPDQVITPMRTALTAFVGRTLRGPVNRPVTVTSFSQFQQVFGGLWQPGLLSYAVEQYFDNGGREAIVVRVVNGATAATMSLAAGTEKLTLRAVRPGTREFLRASVDYDNILLDNVFEFNLLVQRVRLQGTEQVEDQESFQQVSLLPTSERYLLRVLTESELVRVQGILPALRPDRTLDPNSGLATRYAFSNSDGDDGAPLTDYDLIGSALDKTGLFALTQVEQFNLLCIPPPTRETDVGPSALLVAARFCRERRAMLIVDPPCAWATADDALRGMRRWDFYDENTLMHFPRILAYDKLRARFEAFASCGAVAGMLARADASESGWSPARIEEVALRPGFRLSCLVTEVARAKLAARGVNTLQVVRAGVKNGVPLRTLTPSTGYSSEWKSLAARRLALYIVNSLEHGTRWVILAPQPAKVAAAVELQVRAFFVDLYAAGAFGDRHLEDAYFVNCDQDNHRLLADPHEFQLLIGFTAERASDEFHGFRIAHFPTGSKVSAVNASLYRS